ncbi:Oidioi.mRNA.OKI2018_I69.PAR.g12831.t1.cds [Oikopleura dioica]|uniref:Oidioi.mRNA.OKI2018_I69.PAR.g12831.t1.cds n=1 Tax=Oikopleura dioica TaxID=34765 RepID=A0ABN7S1W8_OIKDI|nr:Oidioi.mRNA.OKI2018_I69.PAR.g12831.t1.cds [Oikopleura dioica]
MCEGLCGTNTPPSYTSFYCNLDEVESPNDCDKWQPQHEDWGHLMPNALLNQVRDAANSTFTLTNVSPQLGEFNEGAWNQLECMVRKFMEEEINNEDFGSSLELTGKFT